MSVTNTWSHAVAVVSVSLAGMCLIALVGGTGGGHRLAVCFDSGVIKGVHCTTEEGSAPAPQTPSPPPLLKVYFFPGVIISAMETPPLGH